VGLQEDRAAVLGDLVNGHPEKIADVLPELEAILRDPDDHYALVEAIIALGHAWDPRAAALLVDLVDADHPEAIVRLALVRALPGGATEEPLRGQAIAILVTRTADEVDEVRDWACFGLGQLDADGDEVRAALVARLADEHTDTRCEALLALAKTGDSRAIEQTIARLSVANPDQIYLLEVQAAGELADPVLLVSLVRLQGRWTDDADRHTQALEFAIKRCQPFQRPFAAKVEQQFVRDVNERLRAAGSDRLITLAGEYPRTTLTLNRPDGTLDHEFGPYRLWDDITPTDTDLDVESWVLTVTAHEQR
jgi:hypothetical protein